MGKYTNILLEYDNDNNITDIENNNNIVNNENNKQTTLMSIKNILNKGNLERIAFCGFSLFTILSNNSMAKICLSTLLVRKLYKLYRDNKDDIDIIVDKFV